MASADVQNDPTICSICFEKFKTPKMLPCLHIFCHSCISSYIVRSCESKEAPVGFSCPLCREFVSSPAALRYPEKWAERLPICEIIEKLLKLGEPKLCLPCQRENEEKEATNMCVTCDEPICVNCTKYHKRILTTRAHLIIPLNEPSRALQLITTLNRNESCPTHPDRDVEFHCNDHQTPCCTFCACTEHRKCSDVEIIKSAVDKTKKEGALKVLCKTITNFEKALSTSKGKYEENLTKIESKSDNIKEVTKRLRKEVNDHLDKIENEHMNERGEVIKNSREILNKSIECVSDRIHFSRHCLRSLQSLEDASDVCFMKEYNRVRETFEEVERQTIKIKGHQLILESTIPKELETIKNLEHFCKVQVSQLEVPLAEIRNVSDMSLSLVYEFQLSNANICSGSLFFDGKIIFANHNKEDIGLFISRLKIDTYEKVRNFKSCDNFFDVVYAENKIYATNICKKSVIIMTSDRFKKVGEFNMQDDLVPFGISLGRGFLVVACNSAILKYSSEGQFIHEYPMKTRTLYVIVTGIGHIVCSNETENTVTCINEAGQVQWVYENQKLVSPLSVDKNDIDNLFVSGSGSNNIHILSFNGKLVKIIEDIPCPAFIKMLEETSMCCVGSRWENIKIYEIK